MKKIPSYVRLTDDMHDPYQSDLSDVELPHVL